MKLLSGPRKTVSNLSELVHQQLNLHALAAVVAVVSVLALTQPSVARIVYTPIKNSVDKPYSLDLNHDGITDFIIQQIHISYYYCREGPDIFDFLRGAPAQGNGVVVSAHNYAAALLRGVEVGRDQSFIFDSWSMAFVSAGYPQEFVNLRDPRAVTGPTSQTGTSD
jgi:hypothetical protein